MFKPKEEDLVISGPGQFRHPGHAGFDHKTGEFAVRIRSCSLDAEFIVGGTARVMARDA